MPKPKLEHISEPPPEVLKTFSKKCVDELGVKLTKKDLIFVFNKTMEAEEAEKLCKTALNSWPHLDKAQIDDFRKIYESNFSNQKQLSDHEVNDAAHRISILAMIQKQRQAGEAIRATMIKHKPVKITSEDCNKLKELFNLAFDIDLSDSETEYYLTLSFWFVWYEEGLAYSLPKALDNLMVHYDKKKRGKRGSLQPDDYNIGYLYRWLAHCYKNRPKEKDLNLKTFTVSSFIKTLNKEFSSIRSFLAGDEQTINKDGTFTMSVKLNDWE
jgi:hypothetical protein